MSQNFSKGKIYKITNDYNNDIYVGSTCDSLARRFSKHKIATNKQENKHRKLYVLMNEIGFDRFRIQLICHYPCEDKYQLRQKEGEYIRQIGTLNTQIAGRTEKQWLEDNKDKLKEQWKQYYEDNKDNIKNKKKQYIEDNKDKYKEYHKQYNKQYYDDNKVNIKEYNKEYRKEYNKERIYCECGCSISKCNLPKHLKTQKHIKLMEQK